jgi:hypothetical protein
MGKASKTIKELTGPVKKSVRALIDSHWNSNNKECGIPFEVIAEKVKKEHELAVAWLKAIYDYCENYCDKKFFGETEKYEPKQAHQIASLERVEMLARSLPRAEEERIKLVVLQERLPKDPLE